METINTLPLINFAKESGWNPIEAWLLGASPVVSGDTPFSNVGYSIAAFQQAHTQQPKFCADRDGHVVSCDSPNRVPGGKSGGENNPILNDPSVPGGQRGNQGSTIPGLPELPSSGEPGASSDLLKWFGVDGEDLLKRIALIVLAIVLIAIAVVSLR